MLRIAMGIALAAALAAVDRNVGPFGGRPAPPGLTADDLALSVGSDCPLGKELGPQACTQIKKTCTPKLGGGGKVTVKFGVIEMEIPTGDGKVTGCEAPALQKPACDAVDSHTKDSQVAHNKPKPAASCKKVTVYPCALGITLVGRNGTITVIDGEELPSNAETLFPKLRDFIKKKLGLIKCLADTKNPSNNVACGDTATTYVDVDPCGPS